MTDERLPQLRASDADRDRVVEILRDALAEGRLDMAEFDERFDATHQARTYGELEKITADLPVAAQPAQPLSLRKDPASGGAVTVWSERIREDAKGSTTGIAVMGGFERKGRWTIGRRFTALCLMGGGELDLREADFAGSEVHIDVFAVMGGVNVIVPPGVEVEMRGLGIMGGFDSEEDGIPGHPGAPRVIVSGVALMGGVGVERKLPKDEERRLKAERKEERRRLKGERRGRRELD
ncbi:MULTISPECIES: DUF1707 SHOCT-like domain-containing protein [Streptomyces]|uniref:DUF1707 SHOCT-like domain-containing protein n=1 Tax=Streptomyces TaxID=1883 RepID=UPI001962558D|nr:MULTISPECIES: DUF1707 domain-containing protein [Streptomyces]QRX92475.1 DUF1707 and DUF2154 domain-containing protein [Streptomyces noursei]UJB42202.1 DUF1707 and DUF2154 domain-containing protein [Streptomyces sp. A1-5]